MNLDGLEVKIVSYPPNYVGLFLPGERNWRIISVESGKEIASGPVDPHDPGPGRETVLAGLRLSEGTYGRQVDQNQ